MADNEQLTLVSIGGDFRQQQPGGVE